MSNKSLSVVMPVYNREDFIDEVVASYLNQTLSDFELIIIDDCSTDHTFQKLNKLAETDSRIKLWRLETNSGVGAARHMGNLKASGDIIVIADSDDVAYPNRLEDIRNYFVKFPETDVYYTNFDILNSETGMIQPRFFQPYVKELLYYINYIPNASSAYKRERYFEVKGYRQEQKIGEDYDLWLQFSDLDFQFGYSKKSMVRITSHPGSIRFEKQNEHRQFIAQVRKAHNCPTPNPEKVKQLANDETYLHFTQPSKIDLWFKSS